MTRQLRSSYRGNVEGAAALLLALVVAVLAMWLGWIVVVGLGVLFAVRCVSALVLRLREDRR